MSYISSSIPIEAVLLGATAIFGFLTFISLLDQIRRVRIRQNILSIEPARNLTNCFVYLTGLIYGAQLGDKALIINSFILFPTIMLQRTIYKYARVRVADYKIALVLLILTSAMFFVPRKEIIYLFVLSFGYVGSFRQLRTLYATKSTGSLSPYVFVVAVLNSITWLLYAYIGDGGIRKITTPIALSLSSITLLLWVNFKLKEKSLSFRSLSLLYRRYFGG
jgi:uncharacterized protein with PQ loop repeat